jgi:uncharacterized membrane protein
LQVSTGVVRPAIYSKTAVGGELPERYKAYIDSLWPIYWTKDKFGSWEQWRVLGVRLPANSGHTRVEFTNTAIYSPLNYFGSGVGIAIANLFSQSPFVAERAGIVGNLIIYCTIMVLAIEALPVFRRGALLIGTSPLLLFQAMSVSPDGLNFCLPLLYFAIILRVRLSERGSRQTVVLIILLLGALMAMLKPTAIVLMGFLLLLPEEDTGGRWRKLLLVLGAMLAGSFLWLWWNGPYLDIEINRWFFPEHHPASEMKAYFIQKPWRFARPLWRAFTQELWAAWPSGYTYVGGWIPAVDYEKQMIPLKVFQICFFLCGGWSVRTDIAIPVVSLLMGLISFGIIALTLWLSYGEIGVDHIPYLAGRYLLFAFFCGAFGISALTHSFLPNLRQKLLWPGLAINLLWIGHLLASVKS